jgi:uncharacterized membrane protein YphA (DoxX/SURF4 family)
MDKLIPVGRTFFGIAFIGLGLEHFVYRQFVTGRAPPWPEAIPGEPVWAWLTGFAVIIAGAAILSGKMARAAAIALSVLVFGWALLRHIPVVAASEVLSADWTRAVKALAFVGGALAVAATFPPLGSPRSTAVAKVLNQDAAFMVTARICLAVFMINNGIQHFIFTEFVASLIPVWFPGNPVLWTYFSAAALFAGALGILFPPTARPAALLTGLMVFLWVWIVHVPRVFVSVSDNIAVFEALAIAGIPLVLAGYRRQGAPGYAPPSA